jgi:hypothetical protein
MHGVYRLEDAVVEALPRGPRLNLLALGVDEIPVELTTASVDIHLSGTEPALALPEVTRDPEGSDNEGSEVGGEEVRGGTDLALDTDR